MAIPLFDTDGQLAPLLPRIKERVAHVIDRGRFILGPEVQGFEAEFASYLGVKHVIGVANGTDAITIALRAVGVEAGDEVVLPSFTFYATAEAAASTGIRPVFCDVDPATRNVTVETVKAALTPRTRAILAVDLFGVPAPIPELRTLGLPVIEDAAQAAGASLGGVSAGALGDVATFSFYPSKNLGCLGDGGAVATGDDHVAELVRALRFHGSRDKQTFEHVGYNSRLDELQAAALRVMLPELDGWSEGRRAAARAYATAGLGEHVTLPAVPEGASPAWHLYAVCDSHPDSLRAALAERGIESRGYYRTPVHRQPAMRQFAGGASLPATDELARCNLALPINPFLGEAEAAAVVAAVAGARSGTGAGRS
jgi:dTDP-3-amino-3,4,6-trideoxy-alpha-D-glucose transaminase